MVILGLGHRGDPVDEIDGLEPVLELEGFDELCIGVDQPAIELVLQRHDLIMGQGRRAAAAGDALVVGEAGGHPGWNNLSDVKTPPRDWWRAASVTRWQMPTRVLLVAAAALAVVLG